MFRFYHTDQNLQNVSYYKGTLFEGLLSRFLQKHGYKVELRKKHNSLEYDIEGVHGFDNTKVIGEAKAHEKPINGLTVSAFAGKLLPFHLKRASVRGLFLSTSSMSPDADDYLSAIDEYNLIVHCGRQLLDQIKSALEIPQDTHFFSRLEAKKLYPHAAHLLETNTGLYIAILSCAREHAMPELFTLFRPDGTALADKAFIDQMQRNSPDFQQLEYYDLEEPRHSVHSPVRVPYGISLGSTWEDYRLPASPDMFVGRRDIVQDITGYVDVPGPGNICQIVSRSGVGKSSLLGYIERVLKDKDHSLRIELHDARDVKTVFDLLAVVQRFTGASRPPADIMEARSQVESVSKRGRAVFMVDQFESTFTQLEVFEAYESFLALCSGIVGVVFVVARKNDMLTTYDDKSISLDRLNSLARMFRLNDFTATEAIELIDRISENASRKVSKDVRRFVQEFAQGFPWLVKRTMAHVLRILYKGGRSQVELFTAGLRLDELFDEELNGLDEVQKDYLLRLASQLPASLQQLHQRFDDDPLLARVLEQLTQARLLRLSGTTYDIYNDVFKEYIVYKKLPDFVQAYMHRIWPSTVIRSFHSLVAERMEWTSERIIAHIGLAKQSGLNVIREMRVLGLLTRTDAGWYIPQDVADLYVRGHLAGHVRHALLNNGIVGDIVTRARTETVLVQDIVSMMQGRFVYTEASERTWIIYARTLKAWLVGCRVLDERRPGELTLPIEDRNQIVRELGNLNKLASSERSVQRAAVFLPQSNWGQVERLCHAIFTSGGIRATKSEKALSDLRGLGLVVDGQAQIRSIAEAKEIARKRLDRPEFQAFWDAARADKPTLPEVEKLVGKGSKKETLKWRAKILINWGKNVGLISTGRRYRYK